jgi:uncharacterized Zn ribbon protein
VAKDLKSKGSSSVVKIDTQVKKIRLEYAAHAIDDKILILNPMQ